LLENIMLYPNQTFTDTLPAGSLLALTVVGNGLLSFTSPSGIVTKSGLTANASFGPFQTDQLYKITCITGTIDFSETVADGANSLITAATDSNNNVTGLVGPGGITLPLTQLKASSRPTMLLVGNSLAGVNTRSVAVYTTTITAAGVRPGATTLTLVAGGVAALSLSVNDYIAVGLCNQQPWVVQVTGIAGEVLTLAQRTPMYLRISAGVQKVTLPSLFPTNYRGGFGWVNIANAMCGAPYSLIPGYGFGSGMFSEIISDLAKQLEHHRPNMVFFIPYENDIASGVAYDVLARLTVQAAYMCLNAGATPVFQHCMPSSSIDNSGKSAVYDQINALLDTISLTIPGVRSINFGRVYLSTAVSTKREPLAGWTDGVHPNDDKYLVIARSKVTEMASILGTRSSTNSFNLLGLNPSLSGTGGTASGLQGGSVVPANTTITANAGVTCTTSKNGEDKLVIGMTIPGASNISTTQLTISQTVNLPNTYSSNTSIKAVCRMRITGAGMQHISMLQLAAACGTMNTDSRGPGNLTKTDFFINGDVLTIETMPMPLRDPSATTLVVSIVFRPETLSSPSGVVLDCIVDELGYELSSITEVPWGY
jgi:hypothetical protein